MVSAERTPSHDDCAAFFTILRWFYRSSFIFDPEMFPNPKKYLTDVAKEYDVNISLWINPYISEWIELSVEGR